MDGAQQQESIRERARERELGREGNIVNYSRSQSSLRRYARPPQRLACTQINHGLSSVSPYEEPRPQETTIAQ